MKKILLVSMLFACVVYSQTFTGGTGTITDDGSVVNFTCNVTGVTPTTIDTNFGLVRVCFNINHTWVSDLNAKLISPDGTEFSLFNGIGGDGDNFTSTCLEHDATTSIGSSSAPFTGTFVPQGRMGNMNNGQNPNGTWQLRFVDTYPGADEGILTSWSITFGPNAQGPYIFPGTNIPLVVINTDGPIVNEPKVNGNMRIISNVSGLNYINDSAIHNVRIGIEIRGNYSASLPQKPYGFETRNNLGAELDTAILAMPSEHDWILMANYNDKAFMRNPLAYDLFRDMGHYASRGKLCEVILNGEYQGVYYLCEKIKRDNNRVDVARLDSNETSGLDLTGGYIFKNDFGTGWTSAYHPIDNPSYNVNFAYHYPPADRIVPAQETYIESFVNEAEGVLYSTNFADSLLGYRQYFSLTSFYDYFIVNEVARNNDGFKKSVYFHKEKNTTTSIGKIKMGPVWDFDWAWKNINECVYYVNDGSEWAYQVNQCGPDNPSAAWYVRLLQDTNFANKLHCRYVQLRATILDTNRIFNYIDSTANVMSNAQLRHYDLWQNLGYNSGAPENDSFPSTYNGEVAKFKMWIRKRINWLDQNMPGNASNCNFLSVEENDENSILVFPNPSSDFVYIETPMLNGKLNIFDALGKCILTRSIYENDLSIIDVQNYSTGMYVVQVHRSDGKVFQKKFVKK